MENATQHWNIISTCIIKRKKKISENYGRKNLYKITLHLENFKQINYLTVTVIIAFFLQGNIWHSLTEHQVLLSVEIHNIFLLKHFFRETGCWSPVAFIIPC